MGCRGQKGALHRCLQLWRAPSRRARGLHQAARDGARPDIVKWCNERDIAVEAYCPTVRAERHDDPKVQELAKKHGKTPAQILLRWSVQRGYVPLVKSVTPSRIEENAGIFDFALTDEEVEYLRTDEYSVCSWDPTVKPLEE